MSNISMLSGLSNFSSATGDRSSIGSVSSVGTISGAIFGDSPESTLKKNEHMDDDPLDSSVFDDNTLKRHPIEVAHENSMSPTGVELSESFKLYSTPV